MSGIQIYDDKYTDLTGWLKTLSRINIGAQQLPAVYAATRRVDTINAIKAKHEQTVPDVNAEARRIGTTADLEDADAVLATANLFASGFDTENRDRVTELLERAADTAMGDAWRQFRKANLFDALRPLFDVISARAIAAAETIPEGTLNLDDAARLGHAETYLQLERDIAAWDTIAKLIDLWGDAKILTGSDRRYPIEYMVNDPDAYRIERAGSSNVLRQAKGIRAGTPNLHIPEAAPLEAVEDNNASRLSYYANQKDREARMALPLP